MTPRFAQAVDPVFTHVLGLLERINRDTDRDFYLNAKEAIEYGLADKIVDKI